MKGTLVGAAPSDPGPEPLPLLAPTPGPTPRHHASRSFCIYLLACVPRLPMANPLPCPACDDPAWGGMLWPPLRCRTHPWAFSSPGCPLQALAPTRGSPRTMYSSPMGGLPLSASCVSQQGSNDPAQGPTALPICTRGRGRWVPCGARFTQPGCLRTCCAQRQAWACLPESGHCSRAL